MGQMTGFGQVHPLPGLWAGFHLNTAITLPVGVEAYAAYALRAWLAASTAISVRATPSAFTVNGHERTGSGAGMPHSQGLPGRNDGALSSTTRRPPPGPDTSQGTCRYVRREPVAHVQRSRRGEPGTRNEELWAGWTPHRQRCRR